jgi:photosystem II stability/assembly factor-like uncharacterized protein
MKKGDYSLRSIVRVWLSISILSYGMETMAQFPQATQPAGPAVNQSDDPLLKRFRWREIGPASMGGRIDDFAVVETNPFVYYVGAASGGVWKTTNNGTTFAPVFDSYPVSSIGDIAVSQSDPNVVWVGTGEPNNRQSSSWGDGIYKSTDAGKTFTNVGLKQTHTIARIVIDPRDNNIVYVAALGHLFGPNPERGIFKTTDGGKTWNNIKFIDADTGFTDLAMDPVDSRTLYAASYQRRRTAWGYNGGGPGCGLWKTTDAGKTWSKLENAGLPVDLLGRIGIDVSRSNPNVVYAQIEVGASAGTGGGEEQTGGGGPGGGGGGGGQGPGGQQPPAGPPDAKKSGVWRSDDKGKTWKVMGNNNNRPMYYSQIRVDPKNDQIIYTCGAPFHKSTDGGKTFQVVQGIAHSDHHAVWINPQNPNHLMLGNDGGIDVSYDQGATWEFVNTIALSQFYAVAADMRKPYYVYGGLQDNGSWGGPSSTRNQAGISNSDWFRVGGGDGFYVQIDPTDYNTVYAESQNGAVQRLDLKTGRSVSIRPRGAPRPRPARPAGQAPGANPEQPNAPESAPAAQGQGFGGGGGGGFGGGPPNIVPAPPPGEQYRFNWNTPVHLSPHNPRTIYVGANKLFKSVDRGDTWSASPDLTKQIDRNKLPIMGVPGDKPMASKHDGLGNYSNITTIAESPVLPGLLWVGTDDGNVQLSRDGAATWNNVAKNIPGIPDAIQISRVEPSHFDAGTCYLTVDAHRVDDFKPHVFVTRDFGATWKSIAANLPDGSANVIREDPKNKNLLYLGTEFAMYISLNGGSEWKRFMTGLPTVPIDDILIHPRDNDLIVGTHGRGIYILDDITPLQQLADKTLEEDAHLFDVRPGTQWLQDVTLSRSAGGAKNFRAFNAQPGTAISYYLKSAPSGDVKITISDISGKVVRSLNGTKDAGLNRVQWNLRGDLPQRAPGAPGGQEGAAGASQGGQQGGAGRGGGGGGGGQGGGGGGRGGGFGGPAIDPGTYLVKLSVGGKEYSTKVVVDADTWKD